MATRNLIQVRRGYSMEATVQIGDYLIDNSSKWNCNSVLQEGEIGYEIDTGRFKIGKLNNAGNVIGWCDLDYAGGGGNFVISSGLGYIPNTSGDDTLYSILSNDTNDTNITIDLANLSDIISGASGTYYKLGLANNLTNINNITISGSLLANDATFNSDVRISGNLYVSGDSISFDAATIVLQTLDVADSGDFGNALTVGGVHVSLSGHQHPYTDITNFCSGVADCVNTQLVGGSGISLIYNDSNPSNTTLTVALSGSALNLHSLTDTGLIVKKSDGTFVGRSLSSGNNISISNNSGIDGSPIIGLVSAVTGLSSLSVDNLTLDGNTISSTDNDGNIVLSPNGTGEVDISKVDIDSGTIDGTTIGGGTAAAGTFTSLTVNNSGSISGDLIVEGNLTVNGTSVVANVSTMEVEDPILTLGVASGNIITNDAYDRGLALKFANRTAFMGYDSDANEFVLLGSGVTPDNGNTYESGTYGDLHIKDLDAANIDGTTITASTKFSGPGTDLTGTASSLTAGKATNLDGGAIGEIPYQTASGTTTFLNLGTSGQFLRVNDGVSAPYWDTVNYAEIGNLPTIGTGLLTIGTNTGAGLSVSATPTFSANENSPKTITISSNATSENTASTIVFRDSNKNFSAGTITADLSGTATNALNIEVDPATTGIYELVFVSGTNGNLKSHANSNLRFDAFNDILLGDDGTVPTTKIQYFIIDGGTP